MGLLHPNFRTDYDHYLGSPLAPIELIQYGDLQGKFWHMHDMIYENQKYLCRASFSEFNGSRYDGFDDFDSLYTACQNANQFEFSTTERLIRNER